MAVIPRFILPLQIVRTALSSFGMRAKARMLKIKLGSKMKLRFICLVSLFFMHAANAAIISEYTVSRPDGSDIDYYLVPQVVEPESDTLLLILQGSDCNSVLHIDSILTDYKNVWPQADILLIEKYGINKKLSYSANAERTDCPEKYIQHDSPQQRVEDINRVLNNVRTDDKYSDLIVLGGSEGAVVANLASAQIDGISATVSFNGGGRKFIDDVVHSIKKSASSVAEAEASISGFKAFSTHIINHNSKDIEVSGHGYKWWNQMLSIDQLEVLNNVNTPLLVVQGGRDLSVSPQKVDEMIFGLKKSGKSNIDYLRYEDLDHGFETPDGISMRKEITIDINSWLKSKLDNPL